MRYEDFIKKISEVAIINDCNIENINKDFLDYIYHSFVIASSFCPGLSQFQISLRTGDDSFYCFGENPSITYDKKYFCDSDIKPTRVFCFKNMNKLELFRVTMHEQFHRISDYVFRITVFNKINYKSFTQEERTKYIQHVKDYNNKLYCKIIKDSCNALGISDDEYTIRKFLTSYAGRTIAECYPVKIENTRKEQTFLEEVFAEAFSDYVASEVPSPLSIEMIKRYVDNYPTVLNKEVVNNREAEIEKRFDSLTNEFKDSYFNYVKKTSAVSYPEPVKTFFMNFLNNNNTYVNKLNDTEYFIKVAHDVATIDKNKYAFMNIMKSFDTSNLYDGFLDDSINLCKYLIIDTAEKAMCDELLKKYCEGCSDKKAFLKGFSSKDSAAVLRAYNSMSNSAFLKLFKLDENGHIDWNNMVTKYNEMNSHGKINDNIKRSISLVYNSQNPEKTKELGE